VKILVVDDKEENRYLLETLLAGNGFATRTATNGKEALELLRSEEVDLIISDILMPVMDGFQLCRECKADEELKGIPFVFYSSTYVELKDKEFALNLGADRYIPKPIEPEEFMKMIQGVIADAAKGKLKTKKRVLGEEETFKLYSERLVDKLEKKMLDLQRENTQRKRAEERLENVLEGVIQALGRTTETRDPYTAGHQKGVTQLACAIAEEMKLSPGQLDAIRMTSLMHDIGKMSVPAEILSKPSRLTDIEFVLIKAHPQIAHDILKVIDFPWPVADIVLQHHERMDGSGYPQGLQGDEILLEARIIAVADVVEAMSSHRPYRPSLGLDKALGEIKTNKGILYDADVVDACLKLFEEGRLTSQSQ